MFLALHASAKLMSGKQPLTSLLISCKATDTTSVQSPEGGTLQGPLPVVLCQVLGSLNVDPTAFCSPESEVFQTTKGGLANPCPWPQRLLRLPFNCIPQPWGHQHVRRRVHSPMS